MSEVEKLIEEAGKGGWRWFDKAQSQIDKQINPGRKAANLSKEDATTIRGAWKRFYHSPDGRKALDELCRRTTRQPLVQIHHCQSAEQAGLNAAYREGQNDVMLGILRIIESPEPEENDNEGA